MRSRIRTTLIVSEEKDLVPKYIHDCTHDFNKEQETCLKEKRKNRTKVLPSLALNEVKL